MSLRAKDHSWYWCLYDDIGYKDMAKNNKRELAAFLVKNYNTNDSYDTLADAEVEAKRYTADNSMEYGVYQLVEKTVPVVPQIEMVKVS